MKVEKATRKDCEFVLDWLKHEYDEDGEGFWCNRQIIANALADGDLWVIRENGHAVAFQVGHYCADIANVRKDKQRQGYGTALFQASLVRAERDNVNVLSGECSPRASLPFWQKHGFERYGDTREFAPVKVRRVLSRAFDLPPHLPRVNVSVSFYPEEVTYQRATAPLFVQNLVGAMSEEGTVHLPWRVIALNDLFPPGRDLVARVEVDGVERCFCKAKYEEAKNVGVIRDRVGDCFYVDAVSALTSTD